MPVQTKDAKVDRTRGKLAAIIYILSNKKKRRTYNIKLIGISIIFFIISLATLIYQI